MHELLHIDALLAVVASATAFRCASARFSETQITDEERTSMHAFDRFFQMPVFVLLGTMLPWSAWMGWGWAGITFAILRLLLRHTGGPPAAHAGGLRIW